MPLDAARILVARRARALLGALAVCSALVLAACGGGHGASAPASTSRPPPAGAGAGTAPTPSPSRPATGATTTTAPPAEAAQVQQAVAAYQSAHGVPRGVYVLTGTKVSGAEPSWATFVVEAAPGYQATVQGGYGIAHLTNGAWQVVGIGNAEVGCAPGPTVPRSVLTSLGLRCPR